MPESFFSKLLRVGSLLIIVVVFSESKEVMKGESKTRFFKVFERWVVSCFQ